MALEEDIEIINLPKDSGCFKVVQIIINKHPVMLCGSRSKLHANILRDYLDSNVESYKTIPHIKFKEILLPKLEGDEYKVVGMGEAKINYSLHFFRLPYGDSHDYKIYPNNDFKLKLKQQFIGWKF